VFLLSHPTGNQNMRNTALALQEVGRLAEVWTCLAFDPGSLTARMLPGALKAEAARRAFPPTLRPLLRTQPWRELARLLTRRVGWHSASEHERGWCSVDAVYHALDRRIARRLGRCRGLTAVYAYEDGAAASFAAAARLGCKRVYDLPIGYWRTFEAICRTEQQAEPEWASTLVGTRDSAEKRARKDDELAAADLILVASNFTASTLRDYPGTLAPVRVIPYGAPTPPAVPRRWSEEGPLRVLYVGSLSQRKGLSYLFRAVAALGSGVSLTVVGSRVAECPALERSLAAHRHLVSLPHGEVLALMREHDVLVFPSLFEGFGLVITEAMSQGMVVITTPNTAGPDVISDGVDGFVVPIRDHGAIAGRLELLRSDRQRLAAMGSAASAAAGRRDWAAFRSDLRTAIGVLP
jgi:glycosyltransferase involved in cell wall biosynthesis